MNKIRYLNCTVHFLFLFIVVYFFKDVLVSLGKSWIYDSNYQHGFFVLAVFFGLLMYAYKRKEWGFDEEGWFQKNNWRKSIPFWFVALSFSLLGFLKGSEYATLIGFLFLMRLWSFFLLGWEKGKILNFPLFYVFLAIPVPAFGEITIYLQRYTAQHVGSFMRFFNFFVIDEWTFLHIPNMSFEIVPSCTGIQSFLVLLSLVILFVYFMNLKKVYKILLSFFCIPIALVVNFARIVVLLLIGFAYGQGAAMTYWHYAAGVFFYLMALGMVLLMMKIFQR